MRPPIYHTENYILQPYKSKDENKFVEIGLDPRSVEFMGGATGNEQEERKMFRRILEIYADESKQRWFWVWGIFSGENLCGHLELKETEHTEAGELEIVYMMHQAERRKGIMKEVLAFLKEEQKNWKRRIIATANPANRASMSLLEFWGIDKEERIVDKETGEKFFKLVLAV